MKADADEATLREIWKAAVEGSPVTQTVTRQPRSSLNLRPCNPDRPCRYQVNHLDGVPSPGGVCSHLPLAGEDSGGREAVSSLTPPRPSTIEGRGN